VDVSPVFDKIHVYKKESQKLRSGTLILSLFVFGLLAFPQETRLISPECDLDRIIGTGEAYIFG